FVLVVIGAAILFMSISELGRALWHMKDTGQGLVGLSCLGIFAAFLSWGSVYYARVRLQPVPVFDARQQTMFIRDLVELTWTYDGKAEKPNERIVYEVEAGKTKEFDNKVSFHSTERTSFYSRDKVNESWWRVRAKVGGAWTPWSEPVHTTHY